MPNSFLDSFQLVIGLYLLYVAIKGTGQMYRFMDLTEEDQKRVQTPLRLLYALGALLALLEFGLCALQNSMFTRTAAEEGVQITQNFVLEGFPFVTYELLSAASSLLSLGVVALLAGIFLWLRRLSAGKGKK